MAIFTPDDEPYLGRQSVYHLDVILRRFIEEQTRIADWTRSNDLSDLEQASSELVPSASSIARSIRELVRQGYLLSALVLGRPLFERVATLSHLIENPADVALWQQGWPHGSRPSLKQRMTAMNEVKGSPELDPPTDDELREVLDGFNSLVHGDPDAELHGAVFLEDGRPGYTIGKDLGSPARADEICFNTTMMLIALMARCAQLFPSAAGAAPGPDPSG